MFKKYYFLIFFNLVTCDGTTSMNKKFGIKGHSKMPEYYERNFQHNTDGLQNNIRTEDSCFFNIQCKSMLQLC